MSKIEHEKSCSYINLMYPTNPPQPAPCNCRLSRLVDEQELREQLAKEIESRLFAALGMASMCWSEVPTGVFDSERAQEIGNELLELIARGQK
jgi:hypothetical protein